MYVCMCVCARVRACMSVVPGASAVVRVSAVLYSRQLIPFGTFDSAIVITLAIVIMMTRFPC